MKLVLLQHVVRTYSYVISTFLNTDYNLRYCHVPKDSCLGNLAVSTAQYAYISVYEVFCRFKVVRPATPSGGAIVSRRTFP